MRCGGRWKPVHGSASEALPTETGSNGLARPSERPRQSSTLPMRIHRGEQIPQPSFGASPSTGIRAARFRYYSLNIMATLLLSNGSRLRLGDIERANFYTPDPASADEERPGHWRDRDRLIILAGRATVMVDGAGAAQDASVLERRGVPVCRKRGVFAHARARSSRTARVARFTRRGSCLFWLTARLGCCRKWPRVQGFRILT